jgi:DNA (cytosine-5)-methyltransferase 1
MRGTAPGQNRRSPRLLDEPLPTITAGEFHTRLVQPFLIHTTHHGSHRFHSLQKPAPTITGAHRGELALVEPRLMQMLEPESDGETEPVLDADCCRLVGMGTNRTIAKLDILFRMLQPHELAAGMSFPPDYEFTGTKEDKVRMIGNSVPVETAAAMAGSLLSVYAFAE